MDALLPCPFCGGKSAAIVERSDSHERYGLVSCWDCGGQVLGSKLHWMDNTDAEMASLYEAVAAWNQRAPIGGTK